MGYTKQDTLDKCQEKLNDLKTFYQAPIVNYRGKTCDTGDYYTEVIAEFVCNNIDLFSSKIPVITRKASYKTASHKGEYSSTSNRDEEVIAIKMFNQSKSNIGLYDFIGKIIDYQTPLKSIRKDVAGKIDLISYDGSVLRMLELKKPDSIETMLRCVLEAHTYNKTVDVRKLLSDFNLPDDTIVMASPFVFVGSIQHQEMKESRQWLKQLMELLEITPFYIVENNGRYHIKEEY